MERYQYVAILGLDGMGIFDRFADTPFMDAFFRDYAVSHEALSLFPTSSGPNWGAVLYGMNPEVHNFTNNSVSVRVATEGSVESIFRTLRKRYPEAYLCSCCNWSVINEGILERDIGIDMFNAPDDDAVCAAVADRVARKPKLLFVHLDTPDEYGHRYDYGSPEHLRSISDTDRRVERMVQAYRDQGMLEDTLFIAITDHGGFEKGHGGYTDGEKQIFFALRGKTVCRTSSFFAQTKDVNAIVRYAFDLPIPAYCPGGYTAQVPKGLMKDVDAPYFYDTPVTGDPIRLGDTPAPTAKDGLFSFFPPERIRTGLFLDGDCQDITGHCAFREQGHIKYYHSAPFGMAGEMGTTGYLVCPDLKLGCAPFAVAAWLKFEKIQTGVNFYCSTKTMLESGPGFSLAFCAAGTLLGIETDDPASYIEHSLDTLEILREGWLHVIYAFDLRQPRVTVYHQFGRRAVIQLPEIFRDASMDGLPFTVGNDGSGLCNTVAHKNCFQLDDLIVFNGPFDDADAKRLALYYRRPC